MMTQEANQAAETLPSNEQQLREGTERFRSMVELSSDWLWEQDDQFRFTFFSGLLKEKTGLGSNWHLGKRRWDTKALNLTEEDWARHKAQLERHEEFHGLEIQRLDPQGREVWSVLSGKPIFDAAGKFTGYRGLGKDITARKEETKVRQKMEIELRLAQKLESIGRLASGVAHEINTPVQFVSDSVRFVSDAMKDLGALIERYRVAVEALVAGAPAAQVAAELTAAEENADLAYLMEHVPKALDRSLEGLGRVTTIVRSMKEFAHPDQREMTALNLNQSIKSTLIIASHEYKYVADVETDFGDIPLVTCHGGDVNQVILNLVVNSAHAIADVVKGTANRGRIKVRTHHEGGCAVVTINDTGGGIPEPIRDRIFDPFFTTKEVGRGTGQGLAIARSVVSDRHGGELTFESEVGKGTTFFIRLPIAGKRS